MFRIHTDLKVLGRKDLDLDPKSLILDPKLFILDPDPPFFSPNLEISFENVQKSEEIHLNVIHNTSKILKVEDFNPFLSSDFPNFFFYFFHNLQYTEGSGSEIPDFQFEDPDPKLLIPIWNTAFL